MSRKKPAIGLTPTHRKRRSVDFEDIQREWGSYLLYRDDLPERLYEELEQHGKAALKRTDRGRGVVMLSSGTDPYQDRRTAQISRSTIHELISHYIPVRVLTRSPIVIRYESANGWPNMFAECPDCGAVVHPK